MWIFAGVLALGVVVYFWTQSGSERAIESDSFRAVVTHIENETPRGAPRLRVDEASAAPPLVRITYRREDGEEGSFLVDPDFARRRDPALLRLTVGDGLIKEAGQPAPRAEADIPETALASREIAWSRTGDPDEPYVADVPEGRATIRFNPFPSGPTHHVFIDGELEGVVGDWPTAWRRPEGEA